MSSKVSQKEREAILDKFREINVWKRGDERAPNKPLLLLFALARVSRNEDREVRYPEIHEKVGGLLREFGPPRQVVHPEYPFWRLQNDGIWIVRDTDKPGMPARNGDPKVSVLVKHQISAGFNPEFDQALRNDSALIAESAGIILEAHFPASIHDDILSAVGMQLREAFTRRQRDPAFREKVLSAYGRRCAVCGYDVRLGNQPLGLEAAHIKWHQAGGPDIESNGLALCTMHHKMLDLGAISLSPERKILVSQDVNGLNGVDEWLLRFNHQRISHPLTKDHIPSGEFIKWHREQVFKTPERELT
ncbi:MAG: phosphorothioated DNA-binding restriction endonuclease [Candidatus Krumholzibacteriia bacterium]